MVHKITTNISVFLCMELFEKTRNVGCNLIWPYIPLKKCGNHPLKEIPSPLPNFFTEIVVILNFTYIEWLKFDLHNFNFVRDFFMLFNFLIRVYKSNIFRCIFLVGFWVNPKDSRWSQYLYWSTLNSIKLN